MHSTSTKPQLSFEDDVLPHVPWPADPRLNADTVFQFKRELFRAYGLAKVSSPQGFCCPDVPRSDFPAISEVFEVTLSANDKEDHGGDPLAWVLISVMPLFTASLARALVKCLDIRE